MYVFLFFFFKQKTAYEMRISDWSSDVCSSDLHRIGRDLLGCRLLAPHALGPAGGAGGIDHGVAWHRRGIGIRRLFVPPVVPVLESGRHRTRCHAAGRHALGLRARSEERGVGKECVSTFRLWWSAYQ